MHRSLSDLVFGASWDDFFSACNETRYDPAFTKLQWLWRVSQTPTGWANHRPDLRPTGFTTDRINDRPTDRTNDPPLLSASMGYLQRSGQYSSAKWQRCSGLPSAVQGYYFLQVWGMKSMILILTVSIDDWGGIERDESGAQPLQLAVIWFPDGAHHKVITSQLDNGPNLYTNSQKSLWHFTPLGTDRELGCYFYLDPAIASIQSYCDPGDRNQSGTERRTQGWAREAGADSTCSSAAERLLLVSQFFQDFYQIVAVNIDGGLLHPSWAVKKLEISGVMMALRAVDILLHTKHISTAQKALDACSFSRAHCSVMDLVRLKLAVQVGKSIRLSVYAFEIVESLSDGETRSRCGDCTQPRENKFIVCRGRKVRWSSFSVMIL